MLEILLGGAGSTPGINELPKQLQPLQKKTKLGMLEQVPSRLLLFLLEWWDDGGNKGKRFG